MLTCTLIAGALFLSNGPETPHHNFANLLNFELDRKDELLLAQETKGGWAQFRIPEEQLSLSLPAVLNACAEAAEQSSLKPVEAGDHS